MAPLAIHQFLEKADARGARSTVLRPLGWLVFLLFAGLVVSLPSSPPEWLLRLLAVLLVIAVAVYLAAFIFFALKDPDALRSEKFTLSKMAIERTLTGDTLKGFVDRELIDTDVLKRLSQSVAPPAKEADQ